MSDNMLDRLSVNQLKVLNQLELGRKLQVEYKHYPFEIISNFLTDLDKEGEVSREIREAYNRLTKEEEYEVLEIFISTR